MAASQGGADELQWLYVDRNNQEFGPFSSSTMRSWFQQGLFHPIGADLLVRLPEWKQPATIRELYPRSESLFVGPPRALAQHPHATPRDRSRSRGAAAPGAHHRAPPHAAALGHTPPPAHWHPPPGAYGQPQPASDPYGHPPPQPHHAYGPPPPSHGYSAPPPAPHYGQPPAYPGHPVPARGRHYGRIKSYSANNGFGFIDSPELQRQYGRDVFIHRSEIGELSVGDDVSFVCDLNKDGMPQARFVRRLDGIPAVPDNAFVPGKKGVRPKAKAKAKAKAMSRSQIQRALAPGPPRTKEETAARLDKSLEELIKGDLKFSGVPSADAPGEANAPRGAKGSISLDMPLDAMVAKRRAASRGSAA